jgi:undecaprenyl-diphosphatase
MHDAFQQALYILATQNSVARSALVFCAAVLVYPLILVWLVLAARHLRRVTLAATARIVALGILVALASKVLTHVVIDPRPFIVAHTPPLIPTARDNGFPSDHTLLAAALTASMWWIDRRWVGAFALGTLLVLVGRLGVGAHHTLDVLGSLSIAAVAALIVGLLPLPVVWSRPMFSRERTASVLRRSEAMRHQRDVRR